MTELEEKRMTKLLKKLGIDDLAAQQMTVEMIMDIVEDLQDRVIKLEKKLKNLVVEMTP